MWLSAALYRFNPKGQNSLIAFMYKDQLSHVRFSHVYRLKSSRSLQTDKIWQLRRQDYRTSVVITVTGSIIIPALHAAENEFYAKRLQFYELFNRLIHSTSEQSAVNKNDAHTIP